MSNVESGRPCSTDITLVAASSNGEAGVLSDDHSGFQVMPSMEADCFADGDVLKDSQIDQNSGWFEVKKKNRSSGKSNIRKFSGTYKKAAGLYRKEPAGQNGRENFNVNLSSQEQKELCANLNEQSYIKCEDLCCQCAKDAVDDESDLADDLESVSLTSSADKRMLLTRDTAVLTAPPQAAGFLDTPKFKWGNLDDEELTLTQSNTLNAPVESSPSLQVSHNESVTKTEDSTICLKGGEQSSTKELNGLEKKDSGKALANYADTQDVGDKPEISSLPHSPSFGFRIEISDDPRNASGEEFTKDMKLSMVEDLDSAGGVEVDPSKNGTETSRNFSESQLNLTENKVVIANPSNMFSESAHETTSCISSEPKKVLNSIDSNVMELSDNQQEVQEVSVSQSSGGKSSNKQSMEFSVAASMLMGKFEETKLGESKERFRQRLWCYLFENLNRAIDELYFLCELECDMEQIQEALLVLKEAGMDFSELKSRVEGFEKIKKHPSTPQLLFGGHGGGSFPAKVEHRRPHAIAWEVRRMACSPHRAEILSSSLEAFKKVQQITAQKNLVAQSKRREASMLLDIGQSRTELPVKQIPCMNSSTFGKGATSKTEDKQKPPAKVIKQCVSTAKKGNETQVQVGERSKQLHEEDCAAAGMTSADTPSSEKAQNTAVTDLASCKVESTDVVISEQLTSTALTLESDLANAGRTNKSTEKRVSIVDNYQREKKTPKTRSSMDAWKVKRNWEDVLSSPLKSLNRPSRSPCPGWKSTERGKVLHDKLMSPERKRKSPLEMKKEVDEKQARATRIRRELEIERVQRLQKQTEKLNRVSEWQAVRSNKLREGMHARQQRGESRHEAHLAEIARRAGDESSKVSEVRFITSLSDENKKLSLRQKLQDSELRRAERLQIIKIKQKEDVAREEAVLERRRIIEAERLQRLAEAQRKKEEAKARREEERKAASAAREARAVEQVRKKEVRAKAQQEVTELQAQKLIEKLRESELRRKCYLEQIRERAAMESRDQASPSARLSLSKDGQPKMAGSQTVNDIDGPIDKDTAITKQICGNKGISGPPSGMPTVKAPKMALQHQNLKKRVKKIRQRLTAKKYDFVEPPQGIEAFGSGSTAIAAAARSKIGRWLQDLQRFQLARKAGTSGVSFILAEMIKYFDGKAAELHAARQAGLVDFIATALPASHTSKAEASQTTLSLLRILKVLLALPANRSYFISKNLLPPLIPILSTALENFSSQDSVSVTANNSNSNTVSSNGITDEKLDAVGEVLNGLLQCVIVIINHSSTDERQISIQDDLVELLTACEVIHHLRDIFSLFDRPQVEGAPFPAPVLFGLNLLQALTASRRKPVGVCYDAQLSAMLERREAEKSSYAVEDRRQDTAVSAAKLLETTEPSSATKEENSQIATDNNHPINEDSCAADNSKDEPCVASVWKSTDNLEVNRAVENFLIDNSSSESVVTQNNERQQEAYETGDGRHKGKKVVEEIIQSNQESLNVNCTDDKITECGIEKGQTRQCLLPVCPSISFLVSAIAETGLVGLPSLLTAVLLQTNPRSTPEQAAAVLPSNFEEVATCVLKVLNNLACLDLGLVQNLLAMPDLQMEFFHLVSFLLSHCTCKWNNSTDQVASLLLETLLLLGYFALLHPKNQAVLRWGKSPTILHKICDLPFAFFSDPLLMPALVGTLLAVCYGSEQNRDVVREELSMEMLLSLLKSSRTEILTEKYISEESTQTASNEHSHRTSHSIPMDATSKVEKADSLVVQDEESIPAKEEIKRMIEDGTSSDSETNSATQQQAGLRASCGKSLNPDTVFSPIKKLSKMGSKAAVTGEVEVISLNKESTAGRGAISRALARGNALSTSTDNALFASSQTRKTRGYGPDLSTKNGNAAGGPISNKRQANAGNFENQQASVSIPADSFEHNNVCPRSDLMLFNRFPTRLLDMAQDFFAAGL